MPSRVLWTTLCVLALASAAARAQQPLGPPKPVEPEGRQRVTLRLLGGALVTGELVRETEDEIVLEISGIEASFPIGRIARMEKLPSIEDQYLANRRLIPDHDVGQLLKLVDWLVENERFGIALQELDAILERTPGSVAATQARLEVVAKMQLRQQRAPDDAERSPRTDPEFDFPLLTPAQVNLLKVYEVDLSNPPRMLVDAETVQRLISAFSDDPRIPQTAEGREALASRSEAEILALMFQLQARDFYGQVQILDLPEAFKRFRTDVHGQWLLNRCASPRCHGGVDAGRFRLARPERRPNRDEVLLTNFLILERFRTSDGKALIDYDQPERSPLLHLAIQRENSLYPHPEVPGPAGRGDLWRPQFRTERDPGALRTLEWIRSMYMPRPDYPVDYTPPEPPAVARGRDQGPPR
ncbi:MAG: hypothetical protein ACF8R7_05955 [Phycisphaerales bacterium JB039]